MDLLRPKVFLSLTVLLQVCLSLQLKTLIRERRERNMHQKVRNSCAGEGTCCIWGSFKQLGVVRECRPIGNEKKEKKHQMLSQFQACPISLPKGQPWDSQGEQNVGGGTEENTYWFSYLESATLFRCIGKWQSTWALHLPPSLRLKGENK